MKNSFLCLLKNLVWWSRALIRLTTVIITGIFCGTISIKFLVFITTKDTPLRSTNRCGVMLKRELNVSSTLCLIVVEISCIGYMMSMQYLESVFRRIHMLLISHWCNNIILFLDFVAHDVSVNLTR